MRTAEELKIRQAELKQSYQANPEVARGRLLARGLVDPGHLVCHLSAPESLNPAGLHPQSGGDGSFRCPVEIMLAGLVSCAGVTLAAVAHSMRLELETAEVLVHGDLDFCGTLAVNKTAPVGLTAIEIEFRITSSASDEQLEKLLALTHRYCVVWRTLETPPPLVSRLTRVI